MGELLRGGSMAGAVCVSDRYFFHSLCFMVLLLLTAHTERFSVFCMRDVGPLDKKSAPR